MPERTTGLVYADLFDFPDDGLRRELLDGEMLVSPSPDVRHQVVSRRLVVTIATYLDAHGGGEVFDAPLDVILDASTVLQPDVFVVLEANRSIITRENIKGVPDLVVEIVSDPRVDRVRKRGIYERFRVPEYWVTDPDSDRVEASRLGADGRYGKPEIFEPGEILTYAPLPGLRIDLAALLSP